jgi:hypothetical protein
MKRWTYCAGTTVVGKIVTFLCTIAVLLLLCGCTSTSGGTTRHFIFGFGWVSVNNSQTNLAIVYKVNAVGIYGATGAGGKVGIGYMNQQVIEVVTNANLVIEVDSVGKPIKITIPCEQH